MGKNVGLTYGEFKFPSEQGFTGSAGKSKVKGYMRGGHVKSPDKTKGKGMSRKGMPKNVKAKGGPVKKQMGGYMGPEREIAVDDVKITVPKMKGGSVHEKLKHEGSKMGYAYGGQVKDTSGEFVEKRGKQDTMDHGVQPAQKGNNEAEVEAGGNKRLKAGYKKGGKAKKPKISGKISEKDRKIMEHLQARINDPDISESKWRELTQKLQDYLGVTPTEKKARGGAVHQVRDRTKGKGMSKAGFPKTVKAKGGLARYAHGGKARKPYTGYNEQPGGGGNEDARYMRARGGAVKKAGAAQ